MHLSTDKSNTQEKKVKCLAKRTCSVRSCHLVDLSVLPLRCFSCFIFVSYISQQTRINQLPLHLVSTRELAVGRMYCAASYFEVVCRGQVFCICPSMTNCPPVLDFWGLSCSSRTGGFNCTKWYIHVTSHISPEMMCFREAAHVPGFEALFMNNGLTLYESDRHCVDVSIMPYDGSYNKIVIVQRTIE